jgi:hypothetical protein
MIVDNSDAVPAGKSANYRREAGKKWINYLKLWKTPLECAKVFR